MTAQRLDRRLTILRGKRRGCFDPDQPYLERAVRARQARRLRALLRRGSPVLVTTPRWSQLDGFLDDLATDLRVGSPAIESRTLSLAPLAGRAPAECWNWLALALTGFGGLSVAEGEAWQLVSRAGFRLALRTLFERIDGPTPRCLLVHGLEHLPAECVEDLAGGFADHRRSRPDDHRLNLLLAGAAPVAEGAVPDFEPVRLPDHGPQEAVERMVEHLGPSDLRRLRDLVAVVGGIPAVLDAFGTAASERIGEVLANRGAVWRALGALGDELCGAYDAVASIEAEERLQALAAGTLPVDPVDEPLARAGLVATDRGWTRIRARMFAHLPQFA